MQFVKYHGLGNDYIVLTPQQAGGEPSGEQIRLICHRNFGPGSDGILLGPLETDEADFRVRILNPDGSEAEKSGNGLRIFSRYLYDRGLVGEDEFTIMTLGGLVRSRVSDGGRSIRVEMGGVSFDSERIPVAGPPREVINEEFATDDGTLTFCAATVGNPHCVFLRDEVSEAEARAVGPGVEVDARFPNRTNVQFMQVIGRHDIQIEIWERGAGYTLASGSSASASAAVAMKLGLCDSPITVHMPGGDLLIEIDDDYAITMTGPVLKVFEGTIADEAFTQPL